MVSCTAFCSLPKRNEPRSSRQNWHYGGPPKPSANPPSGPTVWRWYANLHSTGVPQILEPRFHLRDYCHIGTIGNLPTFIATMRLFGLSKQPNNCLRREAYEQRHTRPYWGCSRLPPCESANRYIWIVTMSIWQRESSRFAKPSLVNRDWFQSILPPRKYFAIMPASEIGFSRVR